MTQQAIEDTNAAGAPEAPSSDEGVRSPDLTEADLRQLIRDETLEILNPAFNAMRGDLQKVQGILPQLEEVLGNNRRLTELTKRVLKGTLTEEDYASIETADQLADEQAKREKAEREAAALKESQAKNDGGFAVAWDHARSDLIEHVEREGVTEDEALSLQPKGLGPKTGTDSFGIKAHMREWKKNVSEFADKKAKDDEPKPPEVPSRGGSKDVLSSYLQDLKEGKPITLTPAEIDRAYASRPI